MAVERPTMPAGIRHSRYAVLFTLLGLGATYLRLPWTLVALVPLTLAIVESVRAIRAYHRDNAPRRLVVWTGAGILISGILVVAVLLPFTFYPVAKDFQDCMDGANTGAARSQCRAELSRGTGAFLGDLLQPR